MKIKREGLVYDVIEYLLESNEVLIQQEIDYYYPPYKRKINTWVPLKTCEVINTYED